MLSLNEVPPIEPFLVNAQYLDLTDDTTDDETQDETDNESDFWMNGQKMNLYISSTWHVQNEIKRREERMRWPKQSLPIKKKGGWMDTLELHYIIRTRNMLCTLGLSPYKHKLTNNQSSPKYYISTNMTIWIKTEKYWFDNSGTQDRSQ